MSQRDFRERLTAALGSKKSNTVAESEWRELTFAEADQGFGT